MWDVKFDKKRCFKRQMASLEGISVSRICTKKMDQSVYPFYQF